jgi:N-methylhydantoinase B
MVTGVGGGYGDPFGRDPESVWNDVRNELLTVEDAARLYGVTILPESSALDLLATVALRQQLVAHRTHQEQGFEERT